MSGGRYALDWDLLLGPVWSATAQKVDVRGLVERLPRRNEASGATPRVSSRDAPNLQRIAWAGLRDWTGLSRAGAHIACDTCIGPRTARSSSVISGGRQSWPRLPNRSWPASP